MAITMSSSWPHQPHLNSKYKHLLLITCVVILFGTTPSLAADPPRCYSWAGNLIEDEGVVPCRPNATASGEPGSHSSCCNQRTGDVCLSTGLCLNTGGKSPSQLLWLNGCTDKNWRDPACPQYCNPAPNSNRDVKNPTLRACTPRSFCCAGYYDSDEECCRNAFNLTSRGAGKIERLLFPPDEAAPSIPGAPSDTTDNSNNNNGDPKTCEMPSESSTENINNDGQGGSSSSNSIATAGITGGVLGTLLLAALIAVAFLVFQNRKLKRSLLAAEEATTATANGGTSLGNDTYKEQYYHHHHQQQPQQQQPICALPAEVADPNYGLSPPAWVPGELPVSEGRGQLP